jgi:AcrR family transcriptional regulator
MPALAPVIAMTWSSISMVASSRSVDGYDPAKHLLGQLSASGRPSPRRADAARNRERILDAARTALTAADDIDAVTMHTVAQKAGVGQGTLYRHFPTREDLVLAVYHTDVERLIAAATELSGKYPPREAMRRWLAELAAYGCVKRGVSRVVLAAATRRAIAEWWRPLVLDAVQSLLDAGARAGELRGDLDAEDVWPLLGFLWQEPLPAGRAERLVTVVLDGLATQPDSSTVTLTPDGSERAAVPPTQGTRRTHD